MKEQPKYPARPEQFKMRVNRIEDHVRRKFFSVVPAITVLECEMLLKAYYGGERRMVYLLTKKYLWLWWNQTLFGMLYWISDKVGWTKIHQVPETKDYIAHQQRHGAKCSGSPNCEGHCIDRDQPKWFRTVIDRLTGFSD